MKRLCVLAAGVIMSAFMVAAVNAASAGASDKPKQQLGIMNAKKVVQAKIERYKKMREVHKRAYAMRQKAQSGR